MEYTIIAKNTFLNYDDKPNYVRRSQSDCLNHSSVLTAPVYRVVEKPDDNHSEDSDDSTSSSSKGMSYTEYAPSFNKTRCSASTVTSLSSYAQDPRMSLSSRASLNSISRRVSITSCQGTALPTMIEEKTTPLDDFAETHSRSRDQWTTVMIRNIPCRYSQEELFLEVSEVGFPFNFLYLPPARRSPGNLGYAFVNFIEPHHALAFVDAFTGHAFICQPKSKKRAEVMFARLQGFSENVAFYSNVKVTKSKYRPFINRNFQEISS